LLNFSLFFLFTLARKLLNVIHRVRLISFCLQYFGILKTMKFEQTKNQKGFSIVELLIVTVVVLTLSTTALFTIRRAHIDFQRQNLAKDFKTLLDRARYDSIKRRAVNFNDRAKVIINNKRSMSLISDMNQDGTLVPANEIKVLNFAGTDTGKFMVANTNFPYTITYDQNGYVTTIDSTGTAVALAFTICNYNCSDAVGANINAQDTSVINISATGTSTILRGTETLATTNNPTVSQNTSTQVINNLLTVSSQYQN
jgi:prepilin-type N-terminal cleavage/methylation domain-containing protein